MPGRYLTRREAVELISQLASGAAGDSYSPAFVNIDPVTGKITFDFEGHIHADGLDLDAGESATPPDDRKIRWLRESDGVLVAETFGYHTTSPETHSISIRAEGKITSPQTDAAFFANAELPVVNPGDGNRYGIAGLTGNSLASPDGSGNAVASQVAAFVQAWDDVSVRSRFKIIIQDDGQSDYVQMAASGILRAEIIQRNFNPPNLAAHSGNVGTITGITGLAVNDWILGPFQPDPGNRGIKFNCDPVCATAGQIDLWFFNTDTVALDLATQTFTFLIFHIGAG